MNNTAADPSLIGGTKVAASGGISADRGCERLARYLVPGAGLSRRALRGEL